MKIHNKYIKHFEGYISAVLFIILIFFLSTQIFLRYMFLTTVTWFEEVARYCYVFSIYFAFCYASQKDKHIRITFVLNLFPEKLRNVIQNISDYLWILYNLIMVIIGVQLLMSMLNYPYYSASLHINQFYIYIIIPFAFFLMSFRIIQNVRKRFRKNNLEGEI